METIAAECGVSLMTVSRAMRQLPSVSEKTRRRVLETAARLGYMRTTRGGRKATAGEREEMRIVQLIVGENSRLGRFHSELTMSLVRLLAENHFECVIRVSGEKYDDFARTIAIVQKTDADANLIIGNFSDKELHALLVALPGVLLLDSVGENIFESVFSSFSFDNTWAAYITVKHLITCNRRKIALVTGPKNHSFAKEIETGYRNCLTANGIKVTPELICHTDFSTQSAENAIDKLFESGEKFDAVFTNDEMAGGVYHAILKRGLRIPEDVAVCGCDGLPISEQLFPKLTTVILDHRQLANQVVNAIMTQDLVLSPVHMTLRPALQIRESTPEL